MRVCPICTSDSRELLHALQLTSGEWQTIYACIDCGMVYSTLPMEAANYSNASIYTAPNAIGSGGMPADRRRLEGVATNLLAHGVAKDARILDVGCAQGGLLMALGDAGFTNTFGMDPALECVEETERRTGRPAYVSTLDDSVVDKYDLLILSHVLEHIVDPISALRGVKDRLNYGGSAYIEVPDASRYSLSNLPFLDFNSEHINHFCGDTLAGAIRAAGLHVISLHNREIELANGSMYAAVWAWVERLPRRVASPRGRDGIVEYVERSKLSMDVINHRLEFELAGHEEILLWGAGSYLGNVLALPAISSRRVVQVIDRNPALHGKWISSRCGAVMGPDSILPNIPIVISSLIHAPSIAADISRLHPLAKIITLEKL